MLAQTKCLLIEETPLPAQLYQTHLNCKVSIAHSIQHLLDILSTNSLFEIVIVDNLFPFYQQFLPAILKKTQASQLLVMCGDEQEKLRLNHLKNITFVDAPFDFEALSSAIKSI